MLYELKIFYKNIDLFGIKKRLHVSVMCFRYLKNAKAEAEKQEREKMFDTDSVETVIVKHRTAKRYILIEHHTTQRGTYYAKLFPCDESNPFLAL